MRSLDEMQLQAEDVITRATDRSAKETPTLLETKLAGDVVRLALFIRKIKELIKTSELK